MVVPVFVLALVVVLVLVDALVVVPVFVLAFVVALVVLKLGISEESMSYLTQLVSPRAHEVSWKQFRAAALGHVAGKVVQSLRQGFLPQMAH